MSELEPGRRAGVILWGAILGAIVVAAVVATVLGPSFWEHAAQLRPVAWAAAAVAALAVPASRAIPARIGPPHATPAALPLLRTVIATALCEAAGLFGCVAWMLTGSAWAAAAVLIGVGGVIAAFPSEARWRALAQPAAGGGAPAVRG